MFRGLRRAFAPSVTAVGAPTVIAIAGALALASPAQAGWGVDPTQVRDVGPQLTSLQVFRDNDRGAPGFASDNVG